MNECYVTGCEKMDHLGVLVNSMYVACCMCGIIIIINVYTAAVHVYNPLCVYTDTYMQVGHCHINFISYYIPF